MAAKQTCWEYTCLPNTNSIPPQYLDAIRGWTTGPHSSSEYYNNARKYKKISIIRLEDVHPPHLLLSVQPCFFFTCICTTWMECMMWRNFGTCAKFINEQVSNRSEFVLDKNRTMMCVEMDEQITCQNSWWTLCASQKTSEERLHPNQDKHTLLPHLHHPAPAAHKLEQWATRGGYSRFTCYSIGYRRGIEINHTPHRLK